MSEKENEWPSGNGPVEYDYLTPLFTEMVEKQMRRAKEDAIRNRKIINLLIPPCPPGFPQEELKGDGLLIAADMWEENGGLEEAERCRKVHSWRVKPIKWKVDFGKGESDE